MSHTKAARPSLEPLTIVLSCLVTLSSLWSLMLAFSFIWGCVLDPGSEGQTDDGVPQDMLGWNTGSWSKVRRLRIPGCGEDADGWCLGPKERPGCWGHTSGD